MDLQTYLSLDATDMAQLIQRKEIHPTELLKKSFQQLEKVNKEIHAVVHTRKEKAVQEAQEGIDHQHPFAGVPFLLKDTSQALAGEPLTSGSKLFTSFIAEQDANFVKKIREAGFLFIGHTNVPEFALKNITEPLLHGPTRNPWNLNYSPGGSSGGTSAAVAAGIVPVGGASDGGGSIRIPASFTSLFGLKPTRGRTPVGPGVGRQWQGAAIDFVLSRSVRDSAAMLDVQQVVQAEAAFQTPLFPGRYKDALGKSFKRRLKVAFTTNSPVGTPVSNEAKQAVEKVVKWLEAEGHSVEEKEANIDGVQLMKNYYLMNSGEIAAVVQQIEKTIGRSITANDVEIETWMLNEAGKSVSAADFSASLASWDTAAEKMAAFHQTYDFYITPTTAYQAPKIGELTHSEEAQEKLRVKMSRADETKQQAIIYEMFLPSLTYTPFTQLANLTGQPAMSLPVHLTNDHLPLGVQVMATKGDEARLLQLATQIEQTDLWVGMKGNPLF